MINYTDMKRNTKGFYTLEAAIFLPLVVLAVISLGYFMKIEGTWENCMHGVLDESSLTASKSYDGGGSTLAALKVKKRVLEDNSELSSVKVKNIMRGYSENGIDGLVSYTIEAERRVDLPMGFCKNFEFEGRIKFRGFIGRKITENPMGREGLESREAEKPVWIFPYSGEKYHSENCTYVKAAVVRKILDSGVRQKYDTCSSCGSEDIPYGSVVFCFQGENTAYHRGTCRTISRHTIVTDKSEAREKGFLPCSKCGGG